jgi:hypothetical protein
LATAVLLLLPAGLAGCSNPPPGAASAAGSATRLSATLVSPTDIALEWKGREADAAGRTVEFATQARGEYTILQFVPVSRTRYTHPDLLPETPFYYRVRPFYGPASGPVEVTLPDGSFDEEAHKGDPEWAAPRTVAPTPDTKRSIRSASTAAVAAPTGLQATVVDANGIGFTWADHASDEEGYLLEVKPQGSPEFEVAAVLDPDINSFGLVTLPGEKRASYRVRAFYYGKPSNVAHQTTGQERPHG